MNSELGIVIENNRAVVSSRKVAEIFEKPHNDVLKAIRAIGAPTEFNEGNFSLISYTDSMNRDKPEYLMTRDGFTLLAMGFTGSKAMQWKIKYIEAFNAMEAELSNPYSKQIPHTLADALRLAANLEEEKTALAAKVQADAPKVLFAGAVEASQTDVLIGDLAKILKQNGIEIGQNRMFTWLRDNGYLMCNPKSSSYNMPTQRSMEMGLFRVKETVVAHSDGHTTIQKTPKVTGKGQVYFVNLFLSQVKRIA